MDQIVCLHAHLELTLTDQFAEIVQRSMDIVHRAQVQVFAIHVWGTDLLLVLHVWINVQRTLLHICSNVSLLVQRAPFHINQVVLMNAHLKHILMSILHSVSNARH